MQPKPAAHPLACYKPLLLNPPPLSPSTQAQQVATFSKNYMQLGVT